MKLKSYHAETVEAAVRLAGIELGGNAVFLGSRTTDGEDGRYEVTFAVPEPPHARAGAGDQELPTAREPTAHAAALEGSDAPRVGPTASLRPSSAGDGEAPAPPVPVVGLPHWKKFVPPLIDDEAGGTPGPAEAPPERRPTGLAAELPSRSSPPSRLASEGRSEGNLPVTSFGPPISEPAASSEAGAGGSFDARPERSEAAMAHGASGPGAAAPARAPQSGKPPAVDQPLPQASPEHEPGDRLAPPSTPRLSDAVTRLSDDFEKLRRAIEVRQPLHNTVFLSSGELLSDPIASRVYLYLTANEVEPALAAQLLAGLEGAGGQGLHRDQVWEILGERLEMLCQTSSLLGRPGREPRVAALIGPSGAGKTTTIAKLAFRYGPAAERNVRLMTIDPIRVGCQGRSKFGPLRRSKSRPVGEGVAVFVGRLERSLRSPFRAAQA